MCVPMLRSIGSELTKLENMQKLYALFDVMCVTQKRYVVRHGAVFCMTHMIGPINVCTDFESNRYKIDQVRKYAKIVFYLTSCDVKTERRESCGL